MYREICDTKLAWDAELNTEKRNKHRAWKRTLPRGVTIPQSLPVYRETTEAAERHAFGDASATEEAPLSMRLSLNLWALSSI